MKSDLYSSITEKINSGNFSSIFILVDENTEKYCLDIFLQKSKIESYNKIVILSGESNKNIESCISIWDQLNSFKADRKSLLINLGGGVLTDIGGFAASTYLRGINFINIPTTLLGMVDAAHGGKTGIDFKLLKNQIGVFNEPLEVLLDNEYLKTLSKEEYVNGYAEVVKHSLLTNKSNLNFNSLI
jgi:3-dehydroquinate synthase